MATARLGSTLSTVGVEALAVATGEVTLDRRGDSTGEVAQQERWLKWRYQLYQELRNMEN